MRKLFVIIILLINITIAFSANLKNLDKNQLIHLDWETEDPIFQGICYLSEILYNMNLTITNTFYEKDRIKKYKKIVGIDTNFNNIIKNSIYQDLVDSLKELGNERNNYKSLVIEVAEIIDNMQLQIDIIKKQTITSEAYSNIDMKYNFISENEKGLNRVKDLIRKLVKLKIVKEIKEGERTY